MQQVKVVVSTEDGASSMVEIRSIAGDVVAQIEFVGLEKEGYLWTLRDAERTWLAEGKVGPRDSRSPGDRARAIWSAFSTRA